MKLVASWITVCAIWSTLASGELLAQQRAPPIATVHVAVFGPFGAAIRESKVRLLTYDRKREISEQQGEPTFSGVPYGRYLVVVFDKGGGMAEKELTVNAPDVWVRVGIPFPSGSRVWPAGDLTITGEIVPSPVNSKDWWVRVEGIFVNVSRESPVVNAGRFSVAGLEMGAYVIEVFEGGKVHHIETVEIDTNESTKHVKISLQPTRQQ